MATQSLYRRYRPRRFAEVKGQDHVVRALRTAVADGRAGQAYLFSGPRGTGKTTSARILAKVLNCENPSDGEPCCECPSCVAVERGTSFDVHELDAASNNGVDAMRDLIEKASLGTPGRHKVYILDEVHMLSKAAEAALLKTLEEPPDHVVFVLATTDPQKMSDTIRSRTQHLQFHLLAADTLAEHVRWVAADAGIEVSDAAVGAVLARGGGSPRDTLSALELVASTGGEGSEPVPVGEIVEAMIDADPGRALTAVAGAIAQGRDPRTVTDELIGRLRNGFLSLMAPDLVQLPTDEVERVAEQARRLGPPGLVRGIEVLGAALAEMRHAPDPRVLLDVAVVQLTAPTASTDVAALADRLHRIEQQLAAGSAAPPAAGVAPDRAAAPDPTSGTSSGTAAGTTAGTSSGTAGSSSAAASRAAARAASGPSSGAAARAGSGSPAGAVGGDGAAINRSVRDDAPRDPTTGRATIGGRARRAAASAPAATSPDAAAPEAASPDAASPDAASPDAASPDAAAPEAAAPDAAAPEAAAAENASGPASAAPASTPGPAAGATSSTASSDTVPVSTAPSDAAPAEAAAAGGPTHGTASSAETSPATTSTAGPERTGDAGAPVTPSPASSSSEPGGGSSVITAEAWEGSILPGLRGMARAVYTPATFVRGSASSVTIALPNDVHRGKCEQHRSTVEAALAGLVGQPVTVELVLADDPAASGRAGGERATTAEADAGEPDDIDLDELVDAPPETVKTPIDRLAEAFPGSELVDERD